MSENDRGGERFFTLTPAQIVFQVATRVKEYARDIGTSCVMPGRHDEECGALTMGVRCEKCLRLICVGHTYWSLAGAEVRSYCAPCVVSSNEDLFQGEDDED